MTWFWQDPEPSSGGSSPKSRSSSSASVSLPASNPLSSHDRFADNSSSADSAFSLTNIPTPQTLIPTIVLTTSILLLATLYRTHLRRIPNNANIPPALLSPATAAHTSPSLIPSFRKRSLFGHTSATMINDPDNFRLYHTPLGRLALWGTSFRPIPTIRAELKNQTLSLRLAGIDAPELAHFGKPAQPYAQEALVHLRWLVAERGRGRPRIYPLRRDQYERIVGTAFVRRRWLTLAPDGVLGRLLGGWRWDDERRRGLAGPVLHVNVGLEMVRRGWATVYEGKIGVEFGEEGMEEVYREAERRAKEERLGIWAGSRSVPSKTLVGNTASSWRSWLLPWTWFIRKKTRKSKEIETPRQYKLRMKAEEAEHSLPVSSTTTSIIGKPQSRVSTKT